MNEQTPVNFNGLFNIGLDTTAAELEMKKIFQTDGQPAYIPDVSAPVQQDASAQVIGGVESYLIESDVKQYRPKAPQLPQNIGSTAIGNNKSRPIPQPPVINKTATNTPVDITQFPSNGPSDINQKLAEFTANPTSINHIQVPEVIASSEITVKIDTQPRKTPQSTDAMDVFNMITNEQKKMFPKKDPPPKKENIPSFVKDAFQTLPSASSVIVTTPTTEVASPKQNSPAPQNLPDPILLETVQKKAADFEKAKLAKKAKSAADKIFSAMPILADPASTRKSQEPKKPKKPGSRHQKIADMRATHTKLCNAPILDSTQCLIDGVMQLCSFLPKVLEPYRPKLVNMSADCHQLALESEFNIENIPARLAACIKGCSISNTISVILKGFKYYYMNNDKNMYSEKQHMCVSKAIDDSEFITKQFYAIQAAITYRMKTGMNPANGILDKNGLGQRYGNKEDSKQPLQL